MHIYPNYNYQFYSATSPAITRGNLVDSIQASSSFRVVDKYTSPEQLAFAHRNKISLFYNSFKPIVTVRFISAEGKTKIVANFELYKSVKSMFLVFLALCVALEFVMLYFFLTSNLTSIYLVFIPVGFIVFLFLLSHIAFRLSIIPAMEFLAAHK